MGCLQTTLKLDRLSKDLQNLEHREQPSRSWLKHFFDLWYIQLAYNSNTLAAINDIGGTARALAAAFDGYPNLILASPVGGSGLYWPNYRIASASGVPQPPADTLVTGDMWGLVVGTGAGAVAPSNDALTTKVAHGSAAGQMLHGGTEILAPTFANPNGQMVIRRYFTNSSGGPITVTESGLYSPGYTDFTHGYIYCICRDVFAGVIVADTQLLVVTYTVQITV